MKKTIAFLSLLMLAFVAGAQSKIALIVAIGEYEKSTGWSSISSQNDVPLIKAALIKQGFSEKDILVIRDAQATRDGIFKAIDDHLIAKSVKDGIAVFHYSGHGQQLIDDNNDEVDGYDEALVSYNASMRYIPGVYTGQNHIRDEELGARMDKLREKLGKKGNVMVILDACHSGTGTRGGDVRKHRGTEKPCAPEGYESGIANKQPDKNGITKNPQGNENMAAMVGFFGASPHELNYETEDEKGNGVGSLSYAFSKVFSNADKNSTYGGLFDKIKAEMSGFAPRQTPQAEGDLKNIILGGKIAGKLDYYKVEQWNSNVNVTLNAGELQGLYADTKVSFYEVDTKDPSKAKAKATGTIVSTSLTGAVVNLSSPLDKTSAMASWVFVTEKKYGNMEVKVKLDVKNTDLKTSLLQSLAEFPFIKLVETGADVLVDEGNQYSRGSQVKLTSSNEITLLDETVNNNNLAATANTIVERIKSYGQAAYIRGLDVSDKNMDVKFEFVPIEIEQNGDQVREKSRGNIESKIDSSGVMVFKAEKDAFKIKVTNNSNKPLYFTIIDIQPDNKINLVVPNSESGRMPLDYRIDPNSTKVLDDKDIIVFYPPTGNEVFKLIASEKPLELSGIISTRGAGDKDNNPFAVLFSESYKSTGSRGPKMPNVPAGGANVYTVTFKVVD